MTDVYCIGDQQVFLDYKSYIQYCKENGIKPRYSDPGVPVPRSYVDGKLFRPAWGNKKR